MNRCLFTPIGSCAIAKGRLIHVKPPYAPSFTLSNIVVDFQTRGRSVIASSPLIPLHGLSSAEASRRRAEEGPNSLPAAKRPGLTGLVLEVLREPMFLLLCAASGIYLLIGDVAEALILAASIVVVVAITAALALTLHVPPAAAVFRFAPLGAGELGLALAAGIAGILWIESWKLYAEMRRPGAE